MKILVVDDNESVLFAVCARLQRAGYDATATSDALGLPIRVGELRPDVILMDVDMPVVRGDRLASNLHKLRAARDCAIIFHSGEEPALLESIVARTGAVGFIPKGLPSGTFLERLRMLLAAVGTRASADTSGPRRTPSATNLHAVRAQVRPR